MLYKDQAENRQGFGKNAGAFVICQSSTIPHVHTSSLSSWEEAASSLGSMRLVSKQPSLLDISLLDSICIFQISNFLDYRLT